MPTFRVLGPLEVLADDGEPLPLGGQKQRAVLAVLLLRANEVVSTEFLMEALWGEQPPRTATTSLQNSISALRKLLGAGALLTKHPGYVLAVPREQIDLGTFEQLVGEGRAAAAAERAVLLRTALDLWRGSPLGDLAFEPFAQAAVLRLEELRLEVLEQCVDAELECGSHAALVPELTALVADHPLRERLRGQLMLALYQSGRQADALAAYQDARRLFSGELGLEPSPQLQELHTRILRQEVRRPRRADFDADGDHFQAVADALLAARLVTVVGADAGELAEQLAHRFAYPPDESRELSRIAQYVALTKGSGPLYDELRAMLESRAAPSAAHRFLASLPPLLRERGVPHQLIVTTSYDLALEQAFLEAGELFDVVAYLASGPDRGRFCHLDPEGQARVIELPNTYAAELSLERRTVILKLHGGLDATAGGRWETFVVTEDDYIGYFANGDIGAAVPVALAAKLRRSHMLFLGYGIRDWSLRLVLDRVCGGERLAYRSWAVLPAARPLEREFWRARDVDLLEQPLEEYVDALGQYVGAGEAEAPA